MKKAREFQKSICCFFTDYTKAIDGVDHNKLWKIVKEIRMPDNLMFLLTNLYAGQEASVRIRLGTTNRLKFGKRERQGCILHPAYLTSMQSVSYEMPTWMTHRLEPRLPREISTTSDMHIELH